MAPFAPLRHVSLGPDDACDAAALARAVGWNDAPGDHSVLLAFADGMGFRAPDGALVAMSYVCSFGVVATIAKMIVHPDQRGRGIARWMLARSLELGSCRGARILALVATPLGQPLYERAGFRAVGEVTTLIARGAPSALASAERVASLTDADWPAVLALDAHVMGCDRGAMLAARRGFSTVALVTRSAAGAIDGFALATPQGGLRCVGPVIAERVEAAVALALAASAGSEGGVRIDLAGDQSVLAAALAAHGFAEQTRRPEMTLDGRPLPWPSPARRALAAQAYG